MLKTKNIIIDILNHTLCGILMSGLPEIFGYIHPAFALFGFAYLGYLVSFIEKPYEILYLVANCVGFYLFYHYSIPDVLDSFLLIDSIWINVLMNVGIAVAIKLAIFWKPILKVLMAKYKFELNPWQLVLLTCATALFSVYVTFGWASNVAYTLHHWITYLVWVPFFGTIIYAYFISLIIGILAFRVYNKFLITSLVVFVFSHLIPLPKPVIDKEKTLEVTVIQYPYYQINQQTTPPDLYSLNKTFSKFLSKVSGDVVVFPEASTVFMLDNPYSLQNNPYLKTIQKIDAGVIMSGYKKENNDFYNTSVFLTKENVPQFYYKNKLFPVGEEEVWGISNFNEGQFASKLNKKKDYSIWQRKGFNILPLLCFENFHTFFWQNRIETFNSTVHITALQSNEGWVKDKVIRTNLLGYTKLQAKELGVYVAKADTAGPSAIISPEGEVLAIASASPDVIKASIPKLEANSFFARHGLKPFAIFILLQLIGLLGLSLKKTN